MQIFPVKLQNNMNINNYPKIFADNRQKITACSNTAFSGKCINSGYFQENVNNVIRSVYSEYKKSLSEISLKEIVQIVKEITKETGYSRNEVLTAMQKLTQFANTGSLSDIFEAFKKYNISHIGWYHRLTEISPVQVFYKYPDGANDIFLDRANINSFFSYLMKKCNPEKQKGLKNVPVGYIIDDTNITAIERLKEINPKFFERFVKSKKQKFFIISGWSSGINFADRTKSLKEETKKLLQFCNATGISPDKAIDLPLLKRLKKLNISPVIISRDGLATETCVYRQLAPEQMTQSNLINIIDAASQYGIRSKIKQSDAKNIVARYAQQNLAVYSQERLSEQIKNVYKKVLSYAKSRNIQSENIVFILPETISSCNVICYMSRLINNIKDDQFVRIRDFVCGEKSPDELSGKMLVLLDDCTISGESASVRCNQITEIFGDKIPKVFAYICGTEKAVKSFPKQKNLKLITGEIINSIEKPSSKEELNSVPKPIVKNKYSNIITSVIFSYMSPDNNSEFASLISVFHNFQFKKENLLKTGIFKHYGIKNFSFRINQMLKKAISLFGT